MISCIKSSSLSIYHHSIIRVIYHHHYYYYLYHHHYRSLTRAMWNGTILPYSSDSLSFNSKYYEGTYKVHTTYIVYTQYVLFTRIIPTQYVHYFYLTHVYDDDFPSLLFHVHIYVYYTVDQNYYVESWYIGRKIKTSATTATTTLSSSSLLSSSSSSPSSYHMKKLNMEPFCESCRKFTGPLGPPNLEFLGLKLQIPRLKWDNPQDRTMEGHIINDPKGRLMIIV